MSYLPNSEFTYKDSANLDAFGRLRISDLYTIFDVKFINSSPAIFFDTIVSGGTFARISGESANNLTVNAGTNNFVITQTKRYFNYQSGKSQLVFFTGIFSKQTNVTKRIGLFDSITTTPYTTKNGLYFENDGNDVSINVVKNITGITRIIQSNWNLDKFNGSGGTQNPSGIKIDWTKSQIFVIDFEWLGVGRIRYGFNIDGVTYYCHQVLNANNTIGVYIAYPNLPIRYEIRSNGGAGTLTQICSSVSSEGGVNPNGIMRSVQTTLDGLQINNGLSKPILAIRLKATDRMIEVIPLTVSASNETNGDFYWSLVYYNGNETVNRNGTPTQWTNIPFTGLTYSAIEYKNNFLATDTTIVGQGIEISNGISAAQGGSSIIVDIKNSLLLGSKINGVCDVLVLEIINYGANDTFHASIDWREL